MEEIIEDLMARILHKPLSRRLSPDVEVKTPRGYGVIVNVINAQHLYGSVYLPAVIVVELDNGQRSTFRPNELEVVEVTA